MKIITYKDEGKEKVGAVIDGNIFDLSSYYKNVLDLIEAGPEALSKIAYLSKERTEYSEIDYSILTAPIPSPKRNIFCIGWNYLEHFEERYRQDIELPKNPTVFTKATNTITGPYDEVDFSRQFTNQLDYEAELAVIIGKKGHRIAADEAHEYIFGYSCANDLSARDVQNMHGGQWFLGKSMDNSCPIGPWIVTKDEIEDVQNLKIECAVNDDIVQSSNTNLMMFSVAVIIEELSKAMTLEPGDIILTGTPSGVGFKRNPPILLKQDDVVRVSIEKIGFIENKVIEKN